MQSADQDGESKPLSRMNRNELQELALAKGIDPEQTKKNLLAAIEGSNEDSEGQTE